MENTQNDLKNSVVEFNSILSSAIHNVRLDDTVLINLQSIMMKLTHFLTLSERQDGPEADAHRSDAMKRAKEDGLMYHHMRFMLSGSNKDYTDALSHIEIFFDRYLSEYDAISYEKAQWLFYSIFNDFNKTCETVEYSYFLNRFHSILQKYLPESAFERHIWSLILDEGDPEKEKILHETIEKDPQWASAYADLGYLYFVREEWEHAVKQYETAHCLSDNQKTAEHFFNLGFAYDRLQNYAKAEAAYRECLALDPSYPDANLCLNFCLARLGIYDNTIFRKGIELYTKNGGAFIYAKLGNIYYELEHYAKAEAAYRESLVLDPFSKDVNHQLSFCVAHQGIYDNTIFRKGIELCTKNEGAFVYAKLGDIYYKLSKYALAEAAYRESLVLDPFSKDVNHQLSFCLAHQGIYDNTIFRKGIEPYTKNEGALIYAKLGDIYYELEDDVKAEAAYRESLVQSAFNKDVNAKLGSCLDRQKKYSEAIICYQTGIVLSTTDDERALNYANLGHIYYVWEDWKKVIKNYEIAIEKSAKQNPECFFNLGFAYDQLQDYANAEVAYRECLARDPSYPDANLCLSFCLARQGIYDNTIIRKGIELCTNVERALIYTNLGDIYYESGKYALAEAAYRESLALNSCNKDVNTKLSFCLDRQKKYDDAIICYQKGIELSTNDAERAFICAKLGHIYYEKKEWEKVTENYAIAQHLSDLYNSDENFRKIGISYYALQDYVKAEIAYRKSLIRNPSYPGANGNLGHCLTHQGKYDEAISCYKKEIECSTNDDERASVYICIGDAYFHLEDYAQAEGAYCESLHFNPHSANANIKLGRSLARQERYDQEIFKRAIELCTNDAERAFTYVQIGDIYSDLEKYELAEAEYRESLVQNPSYVAATISLGTSLVFQGRYEEAISCYQKGIELSTNGDECALAYTRLGDIYYIREEWEKAIENYKNAIQISGEQKTAENTFNIGSAYDRLHDYAKAEKAYRECLVLDPSYPDANLWLSFCLAHQGIYDNTIFEGVLNVCTGDEGVLFYAKLGDIYSELEDHVKAETAFRESLALNSCNIDVNAKLGLSLFRQGKYDDAISCYQKGIELSRDNNERSLAYANLGDIYFELQDYAKAETAYRESLDLVLSYHGVYHDVNAKLGFSLSRQGKYDEFMSWYQNWEHITTQLAAVKKELSLAQMLMNKLKPIQSLGDVSNCNKTSR